MSTSFPQAADLSNLSLEWGSNPTTNSGRPILGAVLFRAKGGRPLALLLCLVAAALPLLAASNQTQRALHSALHGTATIAVVLDAQSGRLLAVERPKEVALLASAPGSALKPFFLSKALEERIIDAKTRVFCDRTLRIANRDLACTHPPGDGVFDAERALAYSCNTYFAALAKRFTPQQAGSVLRSYGFGERPHLFAAEASGSIRQPEDPYQLQLLVLGLDDVTVTPAQMAVAYRLLDEELDASPVVRQGLQDSVTYGMAHNAATPGIEIEGKTGTASDAGESWTHGWFAGIARRGAKKIVVVLYVPHGNGGDAALLTRRFLSRWSVL